MQFEESAFPFERLAFHSRYQPAQTCRTQNREMLTNLPVISPEIRGLRSPLPFVQIRVIRGLIGFAQAIPADTGGRQCGAGSRRSIELPNPKSIAGPSIGTSKSTRAWPKDAAAGPD